MLWGFIRNPDLDLMTWIYTFLVPSPFGYWVSPSFRKHSLSSISFHSAEEMLLLFQRSLSETFSFLENPEFSKPVLLVKLQKNWKCEGLLGFILSSIKLFKALWSYLSSESPSFADNGFQEPKERKFWNRYCPEERMFYLTKYFSVTPFWLFGSELRNKNYGQITFRICTC